ncbi:MAG: ribulose-phosphate 3-epimerase [Anaerolineaceae bacterium]|nr:ribulose-phosphate 3-epimerase [Anaerolineaceae bacterium]
MNTIKISASILSANFAELGNQIKETETAGCDWLHIDVMDGVFVPNISMGPFIVKTCKKITTLPLDVHLMISHPENHIDAFIEAGASTLSIHVENNPNVLRAIQYIQSKNVRAGLVLNPGTPASAIESLLPFVDQVLVMTVNPGFSGQVFIPEMLSKISSVYNMIKNGAHPADLQVDGGINSETLPKVLKAGANIIVAATAIYGHPQGIQAGLNAMRETIALNKNRDIIAAISE